MKPASSATSALCILNPSPQKSRLFPASGPLSMLICLPRILPPRCQPLTPYRDPSKRLPSPGGLSWSPQGEHGAASSRHLGLRASPDNNARPCHIFPPELPNQAEHLEDQGIAHHGNPIFHPKVETPWKHLLLKGRWARRSLSFPGAHMSFRR